MIDRLKNMSEDNLKNKFFFLIDIVPYSQHNLFFVSLGLIFTTQVEAFSNDIDNLTLPISLFPFLYVCKTY